MMQLGDWHIVPATPEGMPARCALIIEPVETVTKVDGRTYDVYRAVDFTSMSGPSYSHTYAVHRDPEPLPLAVGRRVHRAGDHCNHAALGTVVALGASTARVIWDADPHRYAINYEHSSLVVVDEA